MMAQLNREPRGLKMSELSRRLMVTGGNVTGLTDQLVAEGLVVRRGIPGDRRAYNVRLTPKGKRQFDAMAVEHERWVIELLNEIPAEERAVLFESLGHLKSAIAARLATTTGSNTCTDTLQPSGPTVPDAATKVRLLTRVYAPDTVTCSIVGLQGKNDLKIRLVRDFPPGTVAAGRGGGPVTMSAYPRPKVGARCGGPAKHAPSL